MRSEEGEKKEGIGGRKGCDKNKQVRRAACVPRACRVGAPGLLLLGGCAAVGAVKGGQPAAVAFDCEGRRHERHLGGGARPRAADGCGGQRGASKRAAFNRHGPVAAAANAAKLWLSPPRTCHGQGACWRRADQADAGGVWGADG